MTHQAISLQTDLRQIWHSGRSRQRNRLCNIFGDRLRNVDFVGEAKFAMLHWWAQSPLVLGWRHYATSDKPVSWFNILRCADFSLFYGSLHLAPFLSFSLFLSCHFPATKENLNARLSRTLLTRVSVRICDWNSFYAFSTLSASDERWQQPWIYFITKDSIYYCKST